MTGPDDKPRRRSSPSLSEEEVALWRYVTRGVSQVRGKSRVPALPDEAAELASTAPPRSLEKPTPRPHKSAPAARPYSPPLERAPQPVRPVPLERRKARRIAKGGQEIEAKLDLHGLTQDEASRALEHFIARSSREGLHTVLVITGKGAPSRADEPMTGGMERRERGVLRRMVPLWLDGAALRPLVISYASAHVRHGGQGALYVTLRRRA